MSTEVSKPKAIKIAVSLRADLVEWVDQKARELGVSRSGYISMCVTQYKQALDVQPKLNGLMDSITTLVNGYTSGSLPPDVAQMKLAELDAQYSEFRKK